MKKPATPPPPALLLRCGCEVRFREGQAPCCPKHGVQGVARTVRMPPPRFRGSVIGPHAETADLGPFVGRIRGSDPVKEGAA